MKLHANIIYRCTWISWMRETRRNQSTSAAPCWKWPKSRYKTTPEFSWCGGGGNETYWNFREEQLRISFSHFEASWHSLANIFKKLETRPPFCGSLVLAIHDLTSYRRTPEIPKGTSVSLTQASSKRRKQIALGFLAVHGPLMVGGCCCCCSMWKLNKYR